MCESRGHRGAGADALSRVDRNDDSLRAPSYAPSRLGIVRGASHVFEGPARTGPIRFGIESQETTWFSLANHDLKRDPSEAQNPVAPPRRGIPMSRRLARGLRRDALPQRGVVLALFSIVLLGSSARAVPLWTQTSGPGVASANVVFPNGGSVYLGTIGEGVFRSTNAGTSWTAANAGIGDATVQAFTASPGFLFAGLQFDNAQSGGVVRSSDGGATWLQTSSDIAGTSVFSLLATGGAVYAGDGQEGVFKSTDDGAHWALSNDGIGINPIYGLAVNAGTLYAIASQGMFRSTDGAASWTPVPDMEFRSFFSLASAGTTIIAGGFQSVAVSTNGGSSWKFVEVPLPSFSRIASLAIDGTTIYAGSAGSP